MSNKMLHAFDEWWGTTGVLLLRKAQSKNEHGAGGCELDAFAAGAEWMRGECERIALEYPLGVSYSSNIVLIQAICGIVAKRIKEYGGAQ